MSMRQKTQQQQRHEQSFNTQEYTPKHLEQMCEYNTYPELWLSRALQRVKSTHRRAFWHREKTEDDVCTELLALYMQEELILLKWVCQARHDPP